MLTSLWIFKAMRTTTGNTKNSTSTYRTEWLSCLMCLTESTTSLSINVFKGMTGNQPLPSSSLTVRTSRSVLYSQSNGWKMVSVWWQAPLWGRFWLGTPLLFNLKTVVQYTKSVFKLLLSRIGKNLSSLETLMEILCIHQSKWSRRISWRPTRVACGTFPSLLALWNSVLAQMMLPLKCLISSLLN
jgi:hypothetical protein